VTSQRARPAPLTAFLVAHTDETVAGLASRLAAHDDCPDELDAVAVVDPDGRMVWDLPLLQLLINPGETLLAERLIEARRMSVVVVDDEDLPVGRILADDVIDALMPERGRIHFPRLLQ
jgi:Mg/Co/Ni transporter MgtE